MSILISYVKKLYMTFKGSYGSDLLHMFTKEVVMSVGQESKCHGLV